MQRDSQGADGALRLKADMRHRQAKVLAENA
jgi:hypothetical protein